MCHNAVVVKGEFDKVTKNYVRVKFAFELGKWDAVQNYAIRI